ncbi:MAG: MG2 domain-containing protein, partial [Prolixibacteraceae bacterium]|nr:MG2 domain-containing protein [Prolixibacteraceae bacterium]
MKKPYLFTFFSFILLTASAQTQSPDHWKRVDELIQKQLPESAMKEVENILDDAIRANDFNEIVRAKIYKIRLTADVNPDEATVMIKDFETFAQSYGKPEEKALLHSMLAELYAMFYNGRQYTIDQRTLIEGYVPGDINEWSKNIFFEKISAEVALSLEDAPLLQKKDVLLFEPLLEKKGENLEELQLTLFDFIARRAINILTSVSAAAPVKNPLNSKDYFAPVEEFVKMKPGQQFYESAENRILDVYRQLLAFRLSENNLSVLIYFDLWRLDYVRNASESVQAGEFYLQALQKMEKQYVDNEAVLDIAYGIVFYYYSQKDIPDSGNEFAKLAYDKAAESIERFPGSERNTKIENLMSIISRKRINISNPAVAKPASEMIIKVTTTNIRELKIDIYRVKATARQYFEFTRSNNRYYSEDYPERTFVRSQSLKIDPDENFGEVESDLKIKTPDYGIYEFTITEKGNTNSSDKIQGGFTVSDFAYLERQNDDENSNIYVVDRISGKTIADVEVQISTMEWKDRGFIVRDEMKYKSDENGFVRFPKRMNSYIYFFSKGDDRYSSSQSGSYFISEQNWGLEDQTQIALFTDRSLYRPGQTVYFKGVAYKNRAQTVVGNETFEVLLMNANYQEVSKQTLRTNEFGSFSGEFILPESGLNGAYEIRVGQFSATIYVEEYKRPTFEVTIDKPETEVHFDKEIRFAGNVRAYAGYGVPNAQVRYTIVRRQHRFFWQRYYSPDKAVASGTAVADANGKFEIPFTPERTKNKSSLFNDQFYTYTVEAHVTDTKGETRKGTQTVSVGDKSLFIVTHVGGMYDKTQEMKIPVHTETLNGKEVVSTVEYSICRLENNGFGENPQNMEASYDPLKNMETETLLQGKFDTKDKILTINAKSFVSGYYKIKFTTTDADNKEVTSESAFILYDMDDKKPPVKVYAWMPISEIQIKSGENAQIHFGTSADDVSILYEVLRGNTVFESRWITFSNEIKTFEVPLKKEYGDGFYVRFTFVKDERLFCEQVRVKRKLEDKSLTPALNVFRDKLHPGETAE